ncbi:hypothetical protein [Neobacillus novalis]|uniref:hypothetical protein n=1 Tax=Neobacillus novalis TaxID=220687 RepID=UPI00147136E7|nr:hypothetical protein [Neobacillus novalis]
MSYRDCSKSYSSGFEEIKHEMTGLEPVLYIDMFQSTDKSRILLWTYFREPIIPQKTLSTYYRGQTKCKIHTRHQDEPIVPCGGGHQANPLILKRN